MNSYLGSRMGRMPVGTMGAADVNTSPLSVTGGITGTAGVSGVSDGRGVASVILVAAIGLTVFYVATRTIQGSR